VTEKGGVAIFGGTFDPVHNGHLIMAEEALYRLSLSRLVFLPTHRPAHKRARSLASMEDRVAMLKIAIRGNPRFQVSRMEAERAGLSFTADTLEAMAKRESAEIFFLMGQDSMEEFHTWRDPDRIARLARLVVIPRGERDLPSLGPGLRRRVIFLHPPRIGISSTEIRRRLRRGMPVRYWLPDAVIEHIRSHELYGIRRRG
jgi:nicotinate-nucleotide adenylyltransferase